MGMFGMLLLTLEYQCQSRARTGMRFLGCTGLTDILVAGMTYVTLELRRV